MLAQDDYFTGHEILEGMNYDFDVNISEIEDDPDHVYAVATVTEELRFHSDLDASYDGDQFDGPAPTERTQAVLTHLLETRYGAEWVEFDYNEDSNEVQDWFVRFEIAVKVPADLDEDGLSEKLWEDSPLVMIHNELDPGTFGSQYVFGSLYETYADLLDEEAGSGE